MLNEGIFQFDKITIVPNMRAELIEKSKSFQQIKLKRVTFYLSEVYLDGVSWDLRVMVRKKIVRRFELRMIEESAVHNQLAEKYAAHNRFLKEQIDSAYKETLGQIEYSFEWGSICFAIRNLQEEGAVEIYEMPEQLYQQFCARCWGGTYHVRSLRE